jgi:uncharacterized protein
LPEKIIDVHIHCSNSADDSLISYARFNDLRYNLDELLQLMQESNVERGLLLSPPMKSGGPLPNEKILKLCAKSGGRLMPVFTVEPNELSVGEAIELARKNRGELKGFKIRLGYLQVYAADEIFSPLYDYAEREELPVMFHTGDTATNNGSLSHSHPLTLDDLANERENLKIVACHFGNPWISDVGELIYKHPNVYADISGLFTGLKKDETYYAAKFQELLARKISEAIYFAGGADKVLFGTDYPIETFFAAVSFVGRLDLTGLDSQKIFYGNAKKVFSL